MMTDQQFQVWKHSTYSTKILLKADTSNSPYQNEACFNVKMYNNLKLLNKLFCFGTFFLHLGVLKLVENVFETYSRWTPKVRGECNSSYCCVL